jgi:uncharacterized protein YwqG
MKEQLKEAIEEYLSNKWYKPLLSLAKPAVSVGTALSEEEIMPPGTSKIGGNPDLPKDQVWPTWGGKPLSFLLQINLKDIATFPVAQNLPKTGLLSFFYDSQEQPWGFDPADKGRWKVFYFETSKIVAAEHQNPDPQIEPCDCDLLCFKEALTLPPCGSKAADEIGFSSEESDAYMDMMDELNEVSGHQMFGYPAQVQDGDMQLECQLVSHGLYCGDSRGYENPRRKELEEDSHQWQLLLQLDSDDSSEMMWGDCGRLFFWIREVDLKQANFDHVWVILQCH